MAFPRSIRPANACALAMALLLGASVVTVASAVPASAAVNSISLTVISDGSAPFDALDTGPNNGIVRTNDVVTFGWSYTSDSGPASPITFVETLTAPSSVRFDPSNLAQCTGGGGGGTISPDGHNLTCPVQVDPTGTGLVPITVYIPNTVANGSVITSNLTANSGTLVGGSRTVNVSAAPRLDLRADLLGSPIPASPGGVSGRGFNYSFVVTEPPGAKGLELVTAPLTFTADLNAISPNASLVPGTCTPSNRSDYGIPFGSIGITSAATASNSVVNSGATSCAQTGRTLSVTITGADLSASSVPTTGANRGILGTNDSYLVSGLFVVFVPDSDINSAGGTIQATIQYRGFDPTSISGQSNYGGGYEPGGDPAAPTCGYVANNAGRANNNCYSATFGGRVASYDGNFFTNDVLYDYTDAHGVLHKAGVPSGDATSNTSGDGVVSPGEHYWDRMQIGSSAGPSLVGAAVCDKWDPTLTQATGAATLYHNGVVATAGTDYTAEYATLPMTTDADRRNTPCSVGTWYPTIAAAAGAASVNAVRFQLKWTITNGEYDFFYAGFAAQPNPVGTILANFDGGRFGTSESWGPSYFNRLTNNPSYTGKRLTISNGRLRVAQTNSLGTGQFTAAGSTYTYTLAPTVADLAPTFGNVGGVVLVDTLPPCVAYVPGSASVSVQLTAGSPGADGIPCTGDAGETGTSLQLMLGSVTPNTMISPVTFQVTALRITPDSTIAPNVVVISSDAAVPIDLAKRTVTASIVIRNQIQFAVSESTSTPQVQVADPVNYTIAYRNVTGSVIPTIRIVTELPYNGDANGSSFRGTLNFAAFSRQPANATIECTSDAHGTISSDPASVANTWSSTCNASTTALRTTITNFANTTVNAVAFTLANAGGAAGDQFNGRASGTYTVSGTPTPFPATEVASVQVVASSIGGRTWVDSNGDGVRDAGEPPLSGFPVTLSGTDDRSVAVNRSTTTAGDGTYLFAGMRVGTYTITFQPSGLAAGKQFSPRGVGPDRSVDSDGDPVTGVTAAVSLALGTNLQNVDEGIRTDAPVVSLAAGAATVDFGSPVTLTATLSPSAATGTVAFADTVVSGPLAGSTVGLGTASVSGGKAVLAVTLPAFGANTVLATYSGDGTYPTAASGSVVVEASAAHTALLVTEYRLSGPAGSTDQFVELTNNGAFAVPLAGVAVQTAAGTTVTFAKTVSSLAAGQHFLVAGANYSLGLVATPDLNVATLGGTTGGVRVRAPDTAATVTDAVGSVAGYSSGTSQAALSGTPTALYAWVRLAQSGTIQNTRVNATDFLLVSTTGGIVGGIQSAAGTPSPTSSAGPVPRSAALRSALLDPGVSVSLSPNRVYVAGSPGTLTVRRTITNTTGATITAMQVRINSLSEANGPPEPGVSSQPAAPARLRIVEPTTPMSTVTIAGSPVTVQNLSAGVAPGLTPGAGIKTVMTVPLAAGGLASGASVAVAFTFAVDGGHSFWFGYAVEA